MSKYLKMIGVVLGVFVLGIVCAVFIFGRGQGEIIGEVSEELVSESLSEASTSEEVVSSEEVVCSEEAATSEEIVTYDPTVVESQPADPNNPNYLNAGMSLNDYALSLVKPKAGWGDREFFRPDGESLNGSRDRYFTEVFLSSGLTAEEEFMTAEMFLNDTRPEFFLKSRFPNCVIDWNDENFSAVFAAIYWNLFDYDYVPEEVISQYFEEPGASYAIERRRNATEGLTEFYLEGRDIGGIEFWEIGKTAEGHSIMSVDLAFAPNYVATSYVEMLPNGKHIMLQDVDRSGGWNNIVPRYTYTG
jgi:hypothetical protein